MRCTYWRRLPPELAREARERSAADYLDGAVQCQLSAHRRGEHYGFLDDLEHGTALWLRWCEAEAELVVIPDCPRAEQGHDGEACCLFAGHRDQHTWADDDPSEDAPCTS